jgi:hypothetical protein
VGKHPDYSVGWLTPTEFPTYDRKNLKIIIFRTTEGKNRNLNTDQIPDTGSKGLNYRKFFQKKDLDINTICRNSVGWGGREVGPGCVRDREVTVCRSHRPLSSGNSPPPSPPPPKCHSSLATQFQNRFLELIPRPHRGS